MLSSVPGAQISGPGMNSVTITNTFSEIHIYDSFAVVQKVTYKFWCKFYALIYHNTSPSIKKDDKNYFEKVIKINFEKIIFTV